MKFFKYIPEFTCLLLFTACSSLCVISFKENKITDTQLNPLIALEKLVPQHQVQLLNANNSDQQHYDQLAQLQSEVEALIFEVDVSDTSEQVLKEYKDTAISYIQLTSMLKTSQRLISDNSQIESTVLMKSIDNIRLQIFSYISTPSRTDKAALTRLVNSIDVDSSWQANWRHLQLVKLHSLFVLDNYELAATHRQKLINTPVIATIAQERTPLQQQAKQSTIKQFAGIFGTIFSLVLLFFVVIKRNQNALKQTSDQHREFATNLIDMLDSSAEKIPASSNHN